MNWLKQLTAEERSYWEAKPQSEKHWWATNLSDEGRVETLRTEISIGRWHEDFVRLPMSTQDTLRTHFQKRADEARVRMHQRLFPNQKSEETAEQGSEGDAVQP